MDRSPETKRRQQAERLAQRALRARQAEAAEVVDLQAAGRMARAASPRNPLTVKAVDWNDYVHLPRIWASLARKQLYEVSAHEVAELLAATIRMANGMKDAGDVSRLPPDNAFVIVARKALPFAAEFHAIWAEYWKQQS